MQTKVYILLQLMTRLDKGTNFLLYLSPLLSIAFVNCQLFFEMGPTGFDRMRNDVCKHAGSWDESLE
jgi:hypothetical protein